MDNLQDVLKNIQQPREMKQQKKVGYVARELGVISLVDALQKWEEDPIAKAEILAVLKDSDYPAETHENLANFCAKFSPDDTFIKSVLIGPRQENRQFLIENKPTYQQFHLKYYETNDLVDFYEFVIRLVGQEGFAESQRISLVDRVDFQPLESLTKPAKKK